MKFLFTLFIAYWVALSSAFAGLPPTTAKGQSDATKSVTFNTEVPYNQATTTAAGTKLIETNNENLLVNANFEHSTVTTGWTVAVSATATAETTEVKSGKKALKLALSATNGLFLHQDVTPTVKLQGSNIDNGIWVKTSASTVQLCARRAGATYGSCQTVYSDNMWRFYNVINAGPSSGSVGVSLVTTGATTADVYVDNAYNGISKAVNQGAPNNSFVAFMDSSGNISGENEDWISGNCSVSDTSLYTCTFVTGKFSARPICNIDVKVAGDSSTSSYTVVHDDDNTTTSQLKFRTAGGGVKVNLRANITCNRSGSDFSQPTISSSVPRFPTVTRLTSGSGTYTTPAGAKFLHIRMVGGGGGGRGSGTGSWPAAGAGGNTTFGSSLLTAGGGGAGGSNTSATSGGTNTVAAGPIVIHNMYGQSGAGGGYNSGATALMPGGTGGSTPLGPGGVGNSGGGEAAGPNTGAGGAGARTESISASFSGGGGGAGGYIEVLITSPLASYAYSVGTGGSGGAAGTSGTGGGGGGSGVIIITEYYNAENVPILLGSVIGDTTVKSEKAAGVTTVDYGTYSATLTNASNATSIATPTTCGYNRIGSTVNVTCKIVHGCTAAAGTPTTINISLPIATTQGSTIIGTVGTVVGSSESGRVQDNGSNLAQMSILCGNTGSSTRFVNFMYQVP